MPATIVYDTEIADLHFGDMCKTSKGSFFVPISRSGESVGKKFKVQLLKDTDALCTVPFGIKNFDSDDAPRKNCDLNVPCVETCNWFKQLDEAVIKLAAENAKRWFRKDLTEPEIRGLYQPIVRPDPNGKYPDLLHCKTTIGDGKQDLKLTTQVEKDGKFYFDNSDWSILDARNQTYRDYEVIPIATVSSVWFQSRMFGVTLNINRLHCIATEAEDEFGFAMSKEINALPVATGCKKRQRDDELAGADANDSLDDDDTVQLSKKVCV